MVHGILKDPRTAIQFIFRYKFASLVCHGDITGPKDYRHRTKRCQLRALGTKRYCAGSMS